MGQVKRTAFLTVPLLILPVFSLFCETITLKSGKVLQATILEKGEQSLKVKLDDKILYYKLYYIENIDGIPAGVYPSVKKAVSSLGKENEQTAAKGKEKETPAAAAESDFTAPDDLLTCYKTGIARASEGHFETARVYFNAGLDIDTSHARLWEAFKILRYRKNGYIDSTYAQTFFQGIQAMMNENYTEAAVLFEKIAGRGPENSPVFLNLGFCRYATGDYARAIASLKQSLQSNPDNVRTHHILGMICYEHKDYAQAITSLEKYLRANPSDAEALWALSMAQYISGQYPQAKINFTKARFLFEQEGDSEKVNEIEYLLNELL